MSRTRAAFFDGQKSEPKKEDGARSGNMKELSRSVYCLNKRERSQLALEAAEKTFSYKKMPQPESTGFNFDLYLDQRATSLGNV